MTDLRKAAYKHVSIADKQLSQQARRSKALEEQKKRRAQRVDASRQLDIFANLNLADSDEEDTRTQVVREGLGAFVSRLVPEPTASISPPPPPPPIQPSTSSRKGKKKRNQQRIKKPVNDEPSEWADRCMYAELLEMNPDDPWSANDGLPDDLETGWVAVAPVPVGKRCLAVVQQMSGIAPNTTLRSRALGKPLLGRFPSTIPPNTVLDCILDANWRDNGILHVLDVVKWKGQDLVDCEASFRFWWRDTRLAELPPSPPPSSSSSKYRFSYPTLMLPIPYNADTSLVNLATCIVPAARAARSISIVIPGVLPNPNGMDLDTTENVGIVQQQSVQVPADGLLLYVAEASYESGTSPLSSWVPIVSYGEGDMESGAEAPLDRFQRLVQRRLEKRKEPRATPVIEDDSMDL